MTTVNTEFKIGAYQVIAEASFSGVNLNVKINVDGVCVENSSGYGADHYTFSGLKGAALRSYDEKWLRDLATNNIMGNLLSCIEALQDSK